MDFKGVKVAELRKMVKDSQPKPKDMKRAELVSILSMGIKKSEPDVMLMVEMPKEPEMSKIVDTAKVKEEKKPKEDKKPKKSAKKDDMKKADSHGSRVAQYMSKHSGVSLAEASKAVAKKK